MAGRSHAKGSNPRWVRGVKTVSTFPPEGLFTKDAETIARGMARKSVSPKGIGSGIKMIQYFINRGGKGLSASRKKELEEAKRILQERLERKKTRLGQGKRNSRSGSMKSKKKTGGRKRSTKSSSSSAAKKKSASRSKRSGAGAKKRSGAKKKSKRKQASPLAVEELVGGANPEPVPRNARRKKRLGRARRKVRLAAIR